MTVKADTKVRKRKNKVGQLERGGGNGLGHQGVAELIAQLITNNKVRARKNIANVYGWKM